MTRLPLGWVPPMGWLPPALFDVRDFVVEDYISRFQRLTADLLTAVRKEVVWSCDTVLDQGDQPHCVGFTGADFQNTLPVNSRATRATAEEIYYQCKVLDRQPNWENGSSIHSLMKVLKLRGRINLYAFTTSLTTVKLWLLTKGPVLVGTHWLEGMMEPNASGLVYPTGTTLGGHAYSLIGYDPKSDVLTGLNHWGATWGLNGRFRMTTRDFGKLMTRGVELAMALELPVKSAEAAPTDTLLVYATTN